MTFSFLPGKSAEAIKTFRDLAIPLYEDNPAMLSFRAFREVESPVSLDLIVVSAFRGMAGMDLSNARLRDLASESGTGIGAVYGRIGALSSGPTDQFIQMLPSLGSGDPSSNRLTAFVWYRVSPGQGDAFEEAIEATLAPWEKTSRIPAATGRFLVSDGWNYLRILGFESLGDYEDYWLQRRSLPGQARLGALTTERREVIVASVQELAVR